MISPGQDLELLVSRISVDDLQEIVDEDIVSTVGLLNPSEGLPSTLRRIAQNLFHVRPEGMLGTKEVRVLCYAAMTTDKLDELATRLGLASRHILEAYDPMGDTKAWRRYLGFFGIDAHDSSSLPAQLDQEEIDSEYGLFAHQRRAADRIFRALRGGYGRVVLHMPTGAGKTRTAMHFISRTLQETEPAIVIWLAASQELLDQAAEAFKEAWSRLGNRSVTLIRFWGEHAPDFAQMTDGLIVAGLQKMHAFEKKHPLDILRLGSRVRLVVIDEAHQAIAPTYRKVLTQLSDTGAHDALLGLTATPGRTWNDVTADEQLSEFFGERKVMLEIDGWDDPVTYLMNEGYLAKPTFRRLEYEPSQELRDNIRRHKEESGDYSDKILVALAESVERNVAVINEIRRLIQSGHRRVLLFAASVQHAENVSTTISALGVDSRVVTGATATSARRSIIKAFRAMGEKPIVICNYGVLTTGFDAPNTSAAVIARPTRSLVLYSQMVGRATRGPKAGGNLTCEISTVVDIDLPGFNNVADAFTNWEDIWE